MADQSVALQIKTPDMATPLREAQDFEAGQTNLAAGQTKLQMLNRQNSAEEMQFNNQQIANAAARGIDSDAWDAQFQRLADQGVPGAEQFLKRYSPVLQQRVLDSYGAAQPTTSQLSTTGQEGNAATQTSMFDRIFNGVPTPKLAQSLQKNNTLAALIPTIHDQQSLTEAIRQLDAIGIQNAAQILGGPQWSPLVSPTNLNHVLNTTQGMIGYLQNRVAGASTGVPNPQVKTDMQVVGGVGYDPYTGQPKTPNIYKPVEGAFDERGQPILYSEQGGKLAPGGGGVSIEDAAARIQGVENSTGDPTAKNPRSSATGNGQFIKDTWLETFKRSKPELAKVLTDSQILALRADPQLSNEMTQEYAKQNAAELTKSNLPVTTANLALAHRFPADVAKILSATPNTPMGDIVSAEAVKANPELKGQSVGSYMQGLVRQVGNDPVATGQQPQTSMQTGDPYLAALPSNMASQVKALAEGRMQFPAGFALKSPYWQQMISRVSQYDPSFDAVNYNARSKARADATSGKMALNNNALNTGIGHLEQLSDAVAGLHNVSWSQSTNALKNWFSSEFGGVGPTNFDAIKNRVAPEIVKIWRGTGGAEADIKRDIDSLSDARTPAQLYGAIGEIAGLMGSKIQANKAQYEQAMGTSGLPIQMIRPEAQKTLEKLQGLASGTPATPAVAAVPPPGQRTVGQVYPTPKGQAKWLGTGWELVK